MTQARQFVLQAFFHVLSSTLKDMAGFGFASKTSKRTRFISNLLLSVGLAPDTELTL